MTSTVAWGCSSYNSMWMLKQDAYRWRLHKKHKSHFQSLFRCGVYIKSLVYFQTKSCGNSSKACVSYNHILLHKALPIKPSLVLYNSTDKTLCVLFCWNVQGMPMTLLAYLLAFFLSTPCASSQFGIPEITKWIFFPEGRKRERVGVCCSWLNQEAVIYKFTFAVLRKGREMNTLSMRLVIW